jgi:hypothetical protein
MNGIPNPPQELLNFSVRCISNPEDHLKAGSPLGVLSSPALGHLFIPKDLLDSWSASPRPSPSPSLSLPLSLQHLREGETRRESCSQSASGKPITAKDVKHDLARIAEYNGSKARSSRACSGAAINKVVSYIAQVSCFVVDAGSSNTWGFPVPR